MPRSLSPEELEEWVVRSHRPRDPEVHCAKIRKRVAVPGGGQVGLVSFLHRTAASPGAPDLFAVELWDVVEDAPGEAAVGRMCRNLAVFRAWYAQVLEKAELRGRRRRHLVSLHGNLVSRSAATPGPLVDLLSHYGGELAFWTCPGALGRVELYPWYGKSAPSGTSPLSVSLDHLGWEESREDVAKSH